MGEYVVYIKQNGEWVKYCNCWSWADALREVEFLRKYEGKEAKAE